MPRWSYPFREEPVYRYLALRDNGVFHYRQKINGRWEQDSYETRDPDEAKLIHVERHGDGGFVLERNRKLHCNEAFEEFIERLIKRGRAAGTIERYRSSWKADCADSLGRLLVHKVEAHHVLAVEDAARKRGLSTSSLRNLHVCLSSFFTFCSQAANGYCKTNPAKQLGEDIPPAPKPDRVGADVYFTEAEIDRIAELADDLRGDRDEEAHCGLIYKTLVQVSPEIGWRISEALGTKLPDLNFFEHTLKITRQVARDWRAFDPESWFAATKGTGDHIGDQTRVVPLSPYAERILRDYIDRGISEGWLQRGGLLFPSNNGTPICRRRVARRLRRVSTQFGRTVRAHYFRHTYATNRVLAGVSIDETATCLGHDPKQTYERYHHLVNQQARNEAVRQTGRQATG